MWSVTNFCNSSVLLKNLNMIYLSLCFYMFASKREVMHKLNMKHCIQHFLRIILNTKNSLPKIKPKIYLVGHKLNEDGKKFTNLKNNRLRLITEAQVKRICQYLRSDTANVEYRVPCYSCYHMPATKLFFITGNCCYCTFICIY
jgi:hypothetical protein